MIPGISKRYFRIFFLIKLPHKKNPELKTAPDFFYDNMVLCYSTCPN